LPAFSPLVACAFPRIQIRKKSKALCAYLFTNEGKRGMMGSSAWNQVFVQIRLEKTFFHDFTRKMVRVGFLSA
jgi:hypothetical protein